MRAKTNYEDGMTQCMTYYKQWWNHYFTVIERLGMIAQQSKYYTLLVL